jgi:hypothetical protein
MPAMCASKSHPGTVLCTRPRVCEMPVTGRSENGAPEKGRTPTTNPKRLDKDDDQSGNFGGGPVRSDRQIGENIRRRHELYGPSGEFVPRSVSRQQEAEQAFPQHRSILWLSGKSNPVL